MANSSMKDVTHVLVDGFNIADGIDNLNMKVQAKVAVHHACGQVWDYNFWLGEYEGELTLSGWMDSVVTVPTAVSGNGRINSLSVSDKVVTVLLEGNTLNARCWNFSAAWVTEIEIGVSPDDVHKLTPGITSRGAVDPSILVVPLALRTTAGNTDTAYGDLGADATNGLRAYLQVTGLTLGSATSATVTLRHSNDHITFNPASPAFANVTAIGGQYITVTGTVQQYLSASWAYNGGAGTNITFAVSAAPIV